MVPNSGPPNPVGGAQSVPPTLLRSNSTLSGGAQQPFSSLVSPRTQFNSNSNNSNVNILGNMSNVSPLINHSMGNGVSLQPPPGSAEPDPLSFVSSGAGPSMSQMPGDHSQSQQMDNMQNFQQQFSIPQQQNQLRAAGLGNVAGLNPVKLEPQMGSTDQNVLSSQQLQNLRNIGGVKMEPQQLQSIRNLGPVKLEQPHSDSSMFLQQHQQQQLLQMARQPPQAAVQLNILQQQQRIMQLQQQQQQHILKGLPPRAQLQQQLQQQQQQQFQQSMPLRNQLKPSNYEPGVCARRLTQYMYRQQRRPEDNNIDFWRKFVAEFYAPTAKKRWCVSQYGTGRQTTGVFPQDIWHCEICKRRPGRGFETTAEVLPRLCQIKYASGTMEELLYVDMPHESHNNMGQIVLDYPKAIQESVFEQLRVVRDGHLRIVFNPDLKISSWEFCARKHEELIPRRLIIPQVSQLGAVVQKYQNAVQNASSGLSTQDLQNSCNSFVASARQLAKALEVPLVNDLGYTKRYVRCLQISEVVNSMKDLIDYSRETKTGPMESLNKFPQRNSSSGQQIQQLAQQSNGHQTVAQNSIPNDQNSANATIMQLASNTNGMALVNNSINGPSSASPSPTTIASLLLHQNSMNSRQDSQVGSINSPYCGSNTSQIPSTSSTGSFQQVQPNPSSPFSPPTQSISNNHMLATSRNSNTQLNSMSSPANMTGMQPPPAQPHEPDPSDSQSAVQQIIQDMMSSPMNGPSSMGNEMKGINGISPTINGVLVNNPGMGGSMGYGAMGGVSPSGSVSGLRAAMVNSAIGMNGRAGMSNHMSQGVMSMNHQQQQQDMGNRLLGGLGSVNNFDNLHFDWKPSP